MIARVNPDGTWTAMTLEAAVEFVAENPYTPIITEPAATTVAFRERREQHLAAHGARPATAEERSFIEAWQRLQQREAAAVERGWSFATIERAPGAAHIVTFGDGDPQLASELASASILHLAERRDPDAQMTDLSRARLLDRVEAHDQATP